VVRVISKESRRLVLPRTPWIFLLSDSECSINRSRCSGKELQPLLGAVDKVHGWLQRWNLRTFTASPTLCGIGTCSNTWIVENRSVKSGFNILAAASPAFCCQTYGNNV
jgi:hypothetical protein